MPRTLLTSKEIGNVQRNDLDVSTAGEAVITKVIAGTGISLSSTGVDAGTGDVVINSTSSGSGDVLTLNTFYTDVTNSGAVETLLYSGTIAANKLNTDGFALEANYSLVIAANYNSKEFYVDFGGARIFNSGGLTQNGGSVRIQARIQRSGTATARSITTLWTEEYVDVQTASLTGLNFTGTNALALVVKGEASSDIIAKLGVIQLVVAGGSTPTENYSIVNLSDGATITTDASSGKLFRVTLGGNRALANPTNPTDGQQIVYEFKQDGTGNRTLSLGTDFILPSGATFALSTAAGAVDVMKAVYNTAAAKWRVVAFIKGFAS